MVDQGARDRHALALAPDSSLACDTCAARDQRLVGRPWRVLRLPAIHPGVDERNSTFEERCGTSQQVEGLEDEANLAVADARQLVVLHLAHQVAVQVVEPT